MESSEVMVVAVSNKCVYFSVFCFLFCLRDFKKEKGNMKQNTENSEEECMHRWMVDKDSTASLLRGSFH
jgi:hypothetical protein